MTGAVALLSVAVSVLSGCERGARIEAEKRAEAAEARLVQMDAITTTKDSLMNELMSTTSFISEVNTELSKIKSSKDKKTVTVEERVMPVAEYRAAMLERVRELTARLDDSERRLANSQARLRSLTGKDGSLRVQLAAFDSMVTDYRATIENQRAQIETLTAQIAALEGEKQTLLAEKSKLTEEKTQLTAQVTDLTTFENTVYFTVGTKEELLEKGVAAERGGSRVLGIGWKTGKSLVPAAELENALFTALRKDTDVEIKLPNPEKKYAIVSPQNVKFVEPQPAKDGTWRGSLRITDPQAFWSQSKYLIVVEK